MDGAIDSFPEALFKDASPQSSKIGFHPDTKRACKEGKLLDVVSSKIIAIGDLGVGKTSIINRYIRNVFERDYKPTIGVEYELRKYTILKAAFNMQIWDTSGEERFKAITAAYYRGSHAILVVFDLCDQVSLVHVRNWIDDALNNTRSTVPDIFIVGNKKDSCKSGALRDIRENAKALCGELNAEYWEVSAKSGENVKELFLRVSAICFDKAVLRQIKNEYSKGGKVDVSKTGENGMQTIELGRQKQQDADISKSKGRCCK